MWSPQKKKNGHTNPYWEFMRAVRPGDFVFSFAFGKIAAVGLAKSRAYTCPKPDEFGKVGDVWDDFGWRVDVGFRELNNKISPQDFIQNIRPLLAPKYSPLTQYGHGKELYLTQISSQLGQLLARLIGPEALQLLNMVADAVEIDVDAEQGLAEWEDRIVKNVEDSMSLSETEKRTIVLARKGQGKFRERVLNIERECRLTGVRNPEHLIASHIKPWRVCESFEERVSGQNGFMMTPSIDHLFDRGHISFENNGELLISPTADTQSLNKMGVETNRVIRVGHFTEDQKTYLKFHRERVFLEAKVRH